MALIFLTPTSFLSRSTWWHINNHSRLLRFPQRAYVSANQLTLADGMLERRNINICGFLGECDGSIHFLFPLVTVNCTAPAVIFLVRTFECEQRFLGVPTLSLRLHATRCVSHKDFFLLLDCSQPVRNPSRRLWLRTVPFRP